MDSDCEKPTTLLYCVLLFMSTLVLGAYGSNEVPHATSSPLVATAYAAQLFGEIRIRGSCVFVQSSTGPTEDALIWPNTWTVTIAGDPVTMQTPNEGAVTLANGDRVVLGGGEKNTLAGIPNAQHARLSPDCTAPYWLLSGLPERKP